jgi:transcriptional regulator with XRE-family HTH domain
LAAAAAPSRWSAGHTQESFALAIRMDPSYYAAVERGEKDVCLRAIARIAAGLGVPPRDLFHFD